MVTIVASYVSLHVSDNIYDVLYNRNRTHVVSNNCTYQIKGFFTRPVVSTVVNKIGLTS